MPASLSRPMRVLLDDFNIIGLLTDKLLSLHEIHPEVDRFIGWHPYCFKKDIQDSLPKEVAHLLPDHTSNYSFYDELKSVPGLISFSARHYPTLVRTVAGNLGWNPGADCVLSVEYCQVMFHKIEDNANSLRELATVLQKQNETVWFPIPQPVPVDDDITKKAMLHALADFAKKNPRKFPALVKTAMHDMGYDKNSISSKEIVALLQEVVSS